MNPQSPIWNAGTLHRKIVSAAEMQAIDQKTIQEVGIPSEVLMESAGRCVADAIARTFPLVRRIAVVCGPGNNGADGFVVARTWHNRGGQAEVVVVAALEAYRGEAGAQLGRLKHSHLTPKSWTESIDWRNYDLIVDAVFGTGLKRSIEGEMAQLFERIEASGRPVVAVDIPSGIDATLGRPLGKALKAALTVTFGLPKLGHFLEPGASFRGQLEIHDIGLPIDFLRSDSLRGELANVADLSRILPRRSVSGHKGTFGRVVLVVGSASYPGAAVLSTRAALRAGAGMVYAASPTEVGNIVLGQSPEVIVLARKDWDEVLKDKKAMCIGPGLGSDSKEMVRSLLERDLPPTVVDADALSVLPEVPVLGPREWVLTPHEGEAARLLGWPLAQIQEDRVAAVLEIARRHQSVAVLKGAPTLVAHPDGRFWVNVSGSPVLAQAGTGDVLSGLITALLGQGMKAAEAARLGVYVHGRAAELRQGSSQRGLQAIEVADALPAALDELHDFRA